MEKLADLQNIQIRNVLRSPKLKLTPRYLKTALSLAAVLPLTALALPPQSGHKKISPDAAASSTGQTVPVIIQYKQDPGREQNDRIYSARGSVRKALHSIHGFAANVPASELEQLASDPNVSYISKDRPLG